MKTNFRPASVSDIPALLRMMEAFYTMDHYPFHGCQTEQNLYEFLNNENLGKIWLVESDGAEIGYFMLTLGYSFEFKGRIAFLDELYLQDPYRDSGIGKKILDFIFLEASGLQIKTILLEVEKHNTRAIHLYGKFGFRDHHRFIMSCPVDQHNKNNQL